MAYKNDLRGFKIPTDLNFWLTDQIRQKTGQTAVTTKCVIESAACRDETDSMPPAYSPYGPIYIPVTTSFKGGGLENGWQ